jgi:hypothetical protein
MSKIKLSKFGRNCGGLFINCKNVILDLRAAGIYLPTVEIVTIKMNNLCS